MLNTETTPTEFQPLPLRHQSFTGWKLYAAQAALIMRFHEVREQFAGCLPSIPARV